MKGKGQCEYEDAACPIDLPDPIAALRLRMEQAGHKPKELIPFIGSNSKVLTPRR